MTLSLNGHEIAPALSAMIASLAEREMDRLVASAARQALLIEWETAEAAKAGPDDYFAANGLYDTTSRLETIETDYARWAELAQVADMSRVLSDGSPIAAYNLSRADFDAAVEREAARQRAERDEREQIFDRPQIGSPEID